MFESVPILRRMYFIWALLGVTTLIMLLYIGQTRSLYRHNAELSRKIAQVGNVWQELNGNHSRLAALNQKLSGAVNQSGKIHSHVQFIEYVEAQCESFGLKLVSLPLEKKIEGTEFPVATVQFSVEGAYAGMVQLLYQLEHKDRVGALENIHLSLEKIRLNETRKEILVCEIELKRWIHQA